MQPPSRRGSVGITVGQKQTRGPVVVVKLEPGSSAATCGLVSVGDQVLAVDDVDVRRSDMVVVQQRLYGMEGNGIVIGMNRVMPDGSQIQYSARLKVKRDPKLDPPPPAKPFAETPATRKGVQNLEIDIDLGRGTLVRPKREDDEDDEDGAGGVTSHESDGCVLSSWGVKWSKLRFVEITETLEATKPRVKGSKGGTRADYNEVVDETESTSSYPGEPDSHKEAEIEGEIEGDAGDDNTNAHGAQGVEDAADVATKAAKAALAEELDAAAARQERERAEKHDRATALAEAFDFGMFENALGGLVVEKVLFGSPAYHAGLQEWDVIVKIGDRGAMGMPVEELRQCPDVALLHVHLMRDVHIKPRLVKAGLLSSDDLSPSDGQGTDANDIEEMSKTKDQKGAATSSGWGLTSVPGIKQLNTGKDWMQRQYNRVSGYGQFEEEDENDGEAKVVTGMEDPDALPPPQVMQLVVRLHKGHRTGLEVFTQNVLEMRANDNVPGMVTLFEWVKEGGIPVKNCIKGTPAEDSGLLAWDVMVDIGGVDVRRLDIHRVQKAFQQCKTPEAVPITVVRDVNAAERWTLIQNRERKAGTLNIGRWGLMESWKVITEDLSEAVEDEDSSIGKRAVGKVVTGAQTGVKAAAGGVKMVANVGGVAVGAGLAGLGKVASVTGAKSLVGGLSNAFGSLRKGAGGAMQSGDAM